jgi:DNA-binding GntR family transcriptional regulator
VLASGSRTNERTDLATIQENNNRFHEALEAIGANSVLSAIVRSLRDRTALIFARQSRRRVRENWKEHAEIVKAVISGDATQAALLASRHVYNAAEMPQAAEDLAAKPRRAKAA